MNNSDHTLVIKGRRKLDIDSFSSELLTYLKNNFVNQDGSLKENLKSSLESISGCVWEQYIQDSQKSNAFSVLKKVLSAIKICH